MKHVHVTVSGVVDLLHYLILSLIVVSMRLEVSKENSSLTLRL
jgi:hypothetical protein